MALAYAFAHVAAVFWFQGLVIYVVGSLLAAAWRSWSDHH